MKRITTAMRRLVRSPLYAMALIFAIALAPKVYLLLTVVPSRLAAANLSHPDEARHLAYAGTLWESGVFGQATDAASAEDPVLYPLFLSGFVGAFGERPIAALYVQSLLAAASACIGYQLARRLHGDLAGWLAGLMCATYVPLSLLAPRFLTESLAAFLFLTTLLAADYAYTARSGAPATRMLAWSAMLWALHALTRVIAFPLVAITLGMYAVSRREFSVRRLAACLVAAAAFAAVYSPWVVRNWLTLGQVVVLTNRDSSVRDFSHYSLRFYREGYTYLDARSEAQRVISKRATGRADIAPAPEPPSFAFLADTMERLQIMLGSHSSLGVPFPLAGCTIRRPMALRWYNYLWTPLMFISAGLAGIVALARLDMRLMHVVLVPGALIGLYSLVHAIDRYQVVPYVGLCVPAGVGLAMLMTRLAWQLRGEGRLAGQCDSDASATG